MAKILKTVFKKIFDGYKVVNAKVMLKLDDLYSMATRLRKYKIAYKYYLKKSQEHGGEQVLIKKRKAWCR